MFLDKFFPQHKQQNFTEDDAEQIYQVVKKTHEDILKCRKLVKGEWLYELRQPLTSWDKTRLNILIVELGHTLSIPLLLAASELNQKSFSEIVNILEKVFFRYKIVCNQHITPLKNIYAKEALNIRKNPNNYNVNNLKNELQELMELKASDQKFRDNLVTLEYQESGGSNKPLKYFLMMSITINGTRTVQVVSLYVLTKADYMTLLAHRSNIYILVTLVNLTKIMSLTNSKILLAILPF